MKKSIKKLIKSYNIELKADIKAVKKQYKKDIKALDNKYSKQIEDIKAENKTTIDGQDEARDRQAEAINVEALTIEATNVEVAKKDLEIQNDTQNLKVTEVKPKTKKKM